jgi:hypothetical protein
MPIREFATEERPIVEPVKSKLPQTLDLPAPGPKNLPAVTKAKSKSKAKKKAKTAN